MIFFQFFLRMFLVLLCCAFVMARAPLLLCTGAADSNEFASQRGGFPCCQAPILGPSG